jgi:hypothetical protein
MIPGKKPDTSIFITAIIPITVRHPPSTNQDLALNLPAKPDLDPAVTALLFTKTGRDESGSSANPEWRIDRQIFRSDTSA